MIHAVAVTALSILLAMAVHEGGHAIAMKQHGIPPIEAGLGMPFPPTFRFRTRNGFTWALSPWLLGAYVKPSEEDHERLNTMPYRDAAWCLNAGIITNIVFGLAVAAVTARSLIWAGVCVAIAAVVWLLRRPISAYLLPALALPILALVGYSLAQEWARGETGMGYAGLLALAPTGLVGTLRFVALISLSLGVLNAAPIFPFDNAKVVDRIIAKYAGQRAASVFQTVGTVLALASFVGAIASDLWAAVR